MDDITTRLIAEADKELREEIKKAADPLLALLRDGVCGVRLKGIRSNMSHDGGVVFDTGGTWYELLDALKEDAFRKQHARRREQKVAEFMETVRSLKSQIDGLEARVA